MRAWHHASRDSCTGPEKSSKSVGVADRGFASPGRAFARNHSECAWSAAGGLGGDEPIRAAVVLDHKSGGLLKSTPLTNIRCHDRTYDNAHHCPAALAAG